MYKRRKKIPDNWRNVLSVIIITALLVAISYFFDPEGTGTLAPNADIDPSGANAPSGNLEAYILDVGQGDCIFLRSPSGNTMLVDTGESSAFGTVDSFLSSQGVDMLDVVVATHPHSDHIGGMSKIIESYEIGAFYMPEVAHNTPTFEKMLTALEQNDVNVFKAVASKTSVIEWDDQTEVRLLSPFNVTYDEINDYSIVIRVKFGNTSILLTGDAENLAERLMLKQLPGSYFRANVLKIGHHGASTSTLEKFLATVDPEIAVISVGEGNDYGHPTKTTLTKLENAGIMIYRTDLNSTVKITMDGSKVAVAAEK